MMFDFSVASECMRQAVQYDEEVDLPATMTSLLEAQ
jgi:hypothetical protein